MRKIIVFNLLSLDGYFAGEDGNIDWHRVDDEFNKFAIDQTGQFGMFLFGRVTYELFEEFWPKVLKDPKASDDDRRIAKILEDSEKIVFSSTKTSIQWNNSKIVDEINPEEILELKELPGKDIAIFGSGTIVRELSNLRLIDEYRLLINPVILGKGKLLFSEVKQLDLQLQNFRKFNNGNILLIYKVKL